MLRKLFGGNKANIPEKYASLIDEITRHTWQYGAKLQQAPFGPPILALSPEEQCEFVLAGIEWLHGNPKPDWNLDQQRARRIVQVEKALIGLLKPRLPFTVEGLTILMEWVNRISMYHLDDVANPLSKILQNLAARQAIPPELQAGIAKLIGRLEMDGSSKMLKYAAQLKTLIHQEISLPLRPGEVWSDAALAANQAMPPEQMTAWANLLNACLEATGSAPTDKWWRSSEALVQAVGPQEFKKQVIQWFALVNQGPTEGSGAGEPIQPANADILKALAWLCARDEDAGAARALTALARSGYRKVPGYGPRGAKVGNACIWALGNMPGQVGVEQLALLKARLKALGAQKVITSALETAAKRIGLSAAELEELAAPAYGLEEVGLRRESLGDVSAELVVTGTSSTELTWTRADGKRLAALPKAIKEAFPDEVKELQQAAKDIQKMLPAQRDRIENLYLAPKTWDLPTWRERYLDHPLVGTLARRLIWKFTQGDQAASGIWHAGQIVDRAGQPLEWLADATRVELWHPIGAAVETVLAWREWLAEHQVQQPFKQAHREVYLLTDAERQTGVYSNRFAAHILRQHQFNALCTARGWKNKLRLMVDDYFPPAAKDLPAWGLRAEFWIEGAGDQYLTDTNDTGVYNYVSTDQVRFYQIGVPQVYAHALRGGYQMDHQETPAPLELEQVLPLVFSEIMRDVDLFVGVASIGGDPAWLDTNGEEPYRGYWTSYSFGKLSETSKTRRAVIERLLPRLKIASRCEIREPFLVVHGEVRTYKIHLGSGNILMEPNDQYLCIVPGRGLGASEAAGKVFLPFEGDGLLSVILSKAFLLADDKKITDQTILNQIRRNL